MDLFTLAICMKRIGQGIPAAVSDYLNEHLTNPTNPPIDTSLAIAGAAADAKKTGDELSDLKEGLDKYDNPFEETIPAYTSGIIGISIIDPAESNYTSYRISVIRKDSTWHWFMTLQGYNGTDWVYIDNIASAYDASAIYPRVETLFSNYNKYVVVIDWNYVRTADISTSGITGIILKNTVVNKPFINALVKISTNQTSIANMTTNEQMYNSVFSVPVNSGALGIVDINLYHASYANYEKYRISIIRHNSSYHLHLVLQGYINETWTNIDSILVRAADAPNPLPAVEVIDSVYHRFTATIVWSMMGTLSLANLDYQLKNSVVNRTQIALQTQIKNVSAKADIPSFELADNIKHVVTVKSDGTGDFTSIASAYASITDSALDNQYEIVVYPGTYNENNLEPPPYTHTHGIFPDLTIVDSTGLYDADHPDYSVFDQGHAPSKLSNMMIKSQTKYCVHQDVELRGVVLVNENLTCIRLEGGNPNNNACIGIGADFDGAKFVWRNCTFVNGPVTSHTNPNDLPNANQHIIYENCKFVNAYINLLVSGNPLGEYVCEVKGCKSNVGSGSVTMVIGVDRAGVSINAPWQVIGGGNNFPVKMLTNAGVATDTLWPNVSLTEKTYAVASSTITKGKFITIAGNTADNSTPFSEILGRAVADAYSGDYVPVWTGPIIYTGTNGEYGLDANGNLDSGASNKIGRVYNNIFYPFYS